MWPHVQASNSAANAGGCNLLAALISKPSRSGRANSEDLGRNRVRCVIALLCFGKKCRFVHDVDGWVIQPNLVLALRDAKHSPARLPADLQLAGFAYKCVPLLQPVYL